MYLRPRSEGTSSADVSMPNSTNRLMSSRTWASVLSRFTSGRRAVVALGLLGVGCAFLVGLYRYDLAPSMPAVSVTAYDAAVERLASTVNAALELIGQRPAEPATADVVASASTKTAPRVRSTTGERGPIDSSRHFQLVPLVSTETAQAIAPAPIAEADGASQDDATIDGARIYSPDDADVNPPVAIRSPGLASDEAREVETASLIEILVSETGLVESAKGWQRPGTLGEALESTTALSVVKTWQFLPAHKNGQPVKYRTTVPFGQTMSPAGMRDHNR